MTNTNQRLNQLRLFLRQESILSLKYNSKIAVECTTIAASSVNAVHSHYYSQSYHPVNRFHLVFYLVGALLPLVCIIVKKDNNQQLRAEAIDAFKKGLAVLNDMYPSYGTARHSRRRLNRIIASAMRAIDDFHNAESESFAITTNDLASENLNPNLPDIFHYDQWFDPSVDMSSDQIQMDGSLSFHLNTGAEPDFQASAQSWKD